MDVGFTISATRSCVFVIAPADSVTGFPVGSTVEEFFVKACFIIWFLDFQHYVFELKLCGFYRPQSEDYSYKRLSGAVRSVRRNILHNFFI